MSRSSVSWGIPLSWDPSQVTYVWFDALLNYATAVGYGADPGTADAELFDRVWPPDVNLVGKDILRFHAVYWPAMLMAAGLEPPRKVFAHGWLLVGGEKMSKSKLTGIAPEQIIDTFGSDAFRYYFLRAIQFGQDGSFSWEDMHARYTAELANGLGNLASRGTAMVVRYRDGELPAGHDLTAAEEQIISALARTVEIADTAIGDLDFSTGIVAVKEFIDLVNLYVTEQEPWVLAKEESNAARLDVVLNTIIESVRAIAVLYNSVMPKAMDALWQQIGGQVQFGPLAEQRIADVAKWGQLPPGTKVTKGAALFPHIEVDE
jgi:methionyl-tRNA synthetase